MCDFTKNTIIQKVESPLFKPCKILGVKFIDNMEMQKNTMSPKNFMKNLRAERFSDSVVSQKYTIDRSELEYHFENLSKKNQEKDFENFATQLCKRIICPNIVPATGPYGGGDGKTDATNFPVSKEISLYWGIADTESGNEFWAFAFSLKSDWKTKCKHDIDSILSTKRDFSTIYFITNQLAKSKDRADIIDKYKDRIKIIILDKNWILTEVINRSYYDLVEKELHIDCRKNDDYQEGENDYKRNLQIKKIEKELEEDKDKPELLYKNAERSLRLANLYCQNERDFREVKDKFSVAIRLAKETQSNTLLKNVYYDYAWKSLYWYESYEEYFQSLAEYKKLIKGTHIIGDIERYSNLITSIAPLSLIDNFKDKVDTEIFEFNQFIDSIHRDECSELFCAELRIICAFNNQIIKNSDIKSTVSKLKEAYNEGKKIVGFDIVTLKRCLSVLIEFYTDDDLFSFYDIILNDCGDYLAGVERGHNYIERAMLYVSQGKIYEAISFVGKALVLFIREDSQDILVESLCKIALLYKEKGALWASRSSVLVALYFISKDCLSSGEYDPIFLRAIYILAEIELCLGRITPFCNVIYMTKLIKNKLASTGCNIDQFTETSQRIELLLGRLLLNSKFDTYKEIPQYYDVFNELDLLIPTIIIEYILGDPKEILKCFNASSLGDSQINEYMLNFNENIFPDLTVKFDGTNGYNNKLRTNLLGCEFEFNVENDVNKIKIAEAIMATLEGFFVTFQKETICAPISKIICSITFVQSNSYIIDYVDGLTKRIHIALPPIDVLRQTQGEIISALFKDLIVKIIEGGLISFATDKVLNNIMQNDSVFERFQYLINPFVDDNFFGFDIFSLEQIKVNQKTGIKLLREHPIDLLQIDRKEQSVETNPPNFSEYTIDEIMLKAKTYSIINAPLWDKAQWSGMMYAYSPYPIPPIMGFVFKDKKHGEQIFEQWIQEIGSIDKEDVIKISIIKGVSVDNPHMYRIVVSYNDDILKTNSNGETSFYFTPTRFHNMEVANPQNLNNFLLKFNQHRSYFICAAHVENGSYRLSEKRIRLTKLNIVNAWEIGVHDLLSSCILPDDIIIIPLEKKGVAPVEEVMKRLKAEK